MTALGTSTGVGRVKGAIEYRDRYPEALLKELRPAVKEANQQSIKFWWKTYLPKHFQRGNASRYEMQPRTKQYAKRKAALVSKGVLQGPAVPLVFSGRLMRNATRQIRTSGTSKGARGRMPGTQVANFGGRAGMPPMRSEMVQVRGDEQRRIAGFHESLVARRLRQTRARKTVRV